MIISQNAAYTAVKLAPENAIVIDTEGVQLDYTAEDIERITDEMTSLVYSKALYDPVATKAYFAQRVAHLNHALSVYATGDRLNMLTGMMTIELFIKDFFGISRYNPELLDQYLKIINYKGDRIMSANMSIKTELGSKLSEKFRSKIFRAIKKERNMRFDDDGLTAVISGSRLLISSAMLSNIIADMESVNSIESMVTAFKNDGDLIFTDGNTHPFDSHDSNGKYQRLYFYDFPTDILDDDVLYILNNPETVAFLLTEEESHIPGFMPLIINKSGKIAGKRFFYNDAENDSVALYGQSGEGKTHTMCHIIASRFSQGYEAWVFDTSDSFTYEATCDNLSKKFVDENFIFHRLDDKELDFDIFRIDRKTSLPTQKKELLGIITAGIGDLSVTQTNLLRSVISDLLEVTDVNEPISPDDLLALLDEEGTTYESLRNRLEPFLEDVKEYGLTGSKRRTPFGGDHKIHIVQINEGYSGSENQIVDAMLASIFNYQRENPQLPLSVFIDEVQNQNFSVSSPIRKILKEGRKHHLSIVAATQDFYARSTEIGSALGKAGMQIFHRPTQDSANLVAAELRWKKADMARFDSMNRGDVIIKGNLYSKERGRNTQAILSGHIYDFPLDDIDEEDEGCRNKN